MNKYLDSAMQTASSTANYVRDFFSSTSVVISILLVIGFLIMIIAIVMMALALNKSNKKSLFNTNREIPPLGGGVSRYLTVKGYFKVNRISLSFLKALDFLKHSLGENSHYKLPWFLLVGSEGSGKSTLVKSTDLNQPAGCPDLYGGDKNPFCSWNFFSRGVILDIKGSLFLENELPLKADEDNWRTLLILLSRYRGARPLNGIILTIPATELYGKTKLETEEINAKAEFFMQKLNATQNSLRMRLPVYVLITKSDKIAGFQSICTELPIKNHHNMFGWSSPYNFSHVYSPKWLDEAFDDIQNQFEQLRAELISSVKDSEGKDGLFVFPSEVIKVKDNLSIYLNKIFREDSYHESLILRGVYFCGDSGMQQVAQILTDANQDVEDSFVIIDKKDKATKDTQEDAVDEAIEESQIERKIFFTDDLIDSKIFLEGGLAKPLQAKLITINRSLNLLKFSIASFVLFGSYGLFNTYDRFSQNRDYVSPILAKMSVLLRDVQSIKLENAGHSEAIFDSYAKQLLEMMEQIREKDFFSFLIPASWFSPLHKNLNESLSVSYQTIVIRTIYIDLLLKAKELLNLKPKNDDKSTHIGQLLDPLMSKEYALLKKFLDDFVTLSDKIYKFNNLSLSTTPDDLEDLVSYTFGSKLPKQFAQHYNVFRKMLSGKPFPDIDLKPYQQLARNTLSVIYQNFLNVIFHGNNANSTIGRFKRAVDQIQRKNQKHLPDIKTLREFSVNLATPIKKLGQDGKTWIDGKIFNPGQEFDQLLDKVDDLKVFGKDVTQYLVDQTAVAFEQFKKDLEVINNSFIDNIYVQNNNKNISNPSHGLLTLEKILTDLFSEPYMLETPKRKPVVNVPQGKVVYWDKNLIQHAYEMVQKYEEYVSKKIISLPLFLQEPISEIAKRGLQESILSTLGQAQSFVNIPKNLPAGVASEDILRNKVGDLKATGDIFIKLMHILSTHETNSFFELRTLLNTTSFWLLSEVEKTLQAYSPYAIRSNNFSWWDGKIGLALGAYGVQDMEDLKSYVNLQRQYVKNIALDFAKPIVHFLSEQIMNDPNSRDRNLLNKWKRIVEQCEMYDKKVPANSLGQLEDFIIKSLNSYDLSNCFKLIPLKDTQNKTGDYFLEIIQDIKKKVLLRAEVLARQEAIKNYNNLATFFNNNLKNKFPFVGLDIKENDGEADPEQIREFFHRFKTFGDSAKVILNQVYQMGTIAKEPTNFLLQMEKIKDFLSYYLDNQSDDDVPSLDLSIDFRSNRAQEKGGDLIVDWFFKIGDETVITKQDKVKTGRWKFGESIQIGFKWPSIDEGGNVVTPQPTQDKDQPNLEIEAQSAMFNYNSKWSLLWLLRQSAAPRGSYSSIKDPNPYMLKFKVPLITNPSSPDADNPTTSAVVYNLITLSVPPSKPKMPSKVIRVPDFPISAPSLNEKIIQFNDQPVLTLGIINENSMLDDDQESTQNSADDKSDASDTTSESNDDSKNENEDA
jgi:type VI secretion system protein ImpL